mgnify:FL=1
MDLVDPVNVAGKISQLEEEILQFEKEADLILAESNAVTRINISPVALPPNERAASTFVAPLEW